MKEPAPPNLCAHLNNMPIAAAPWHFSQGWSRRPGRKGKPGYSATLTCLPRCPGLVPDPPSKSPTRTHAFPNFHKTQFQARPS